MSLSLSVPVPPSILPFVSLYKLFSSSALSALKCFSLINLPCLSMFVCGSACLTLSFASLSVYRSACAFPDVYWNFII